MPIDPANKLRNKNKLGLDKNISANVFYYVQLNST